MISRTIPILLLLAVPAFAAQKPAPKPVAEQPITVDGLLTQSRAAQAKGDGELALRLAQSAIVADPARAASYVALGDLYAKAGQGAFARFYYNEALTIDPAQAAALKAITVMDKP